MNSLTEKIVTRLNKMQIRQRMMFIVISTSVISLVVLSLITLFSTFGIRDMAIESGQKIGKQASNDSSEILREQKEHELLATAKDRADFINYMMKDLGRNTQRIAKVATTMLQRPNEYAAEPLFYPDQIKLEGLVTYLQYADPGKEVNPEEVERLSSIQKVMVQTIEYNPMISEACLASKAGFEISAQDFNQFDNSTGKSWSMPRYFNYFKLDWYKNALQAGEVVFSDARMNALDGFENIVFHYSAPYYDARGEIAGVIECEENIDTVNKVVYEADTQEMGFYFVVDKNGHVLLDNSNSNTADDELAVTMKDLRESANEDLAELAKAMTAGETGLKQVTINGAEHYVAYAPVTDVNWSCAEAISVDEVLGPVEKNDKIIKDIAAENVDVMNAHIKNTILMMAFIIFALLAVVIYIGRRLSDRFVRPIRELSDGVREITSGNFDKKLEITTGDEIEHLAICFNAMTDELTAYIENLSRVTAEKEKAAAELSIARNIQVGALPQDFMTEREEFQIYASMDAAKGVGGDFYDFYMTDENHLVVTIADVSGKGVPAALFMMRAKTTLKNLVLMAGSPDDFGAVMTLANQELCRDNETMMFVTVFIAQLDLVTGELIYVSAGHNAPCLRENGKFRYLKQKKKRMMLGVEEDVMYEAYRLTLRPDDMLFLYTDGVTEAMDKEKNLYSEERLEETLNNIDGSLSVEEILAEVRKDIEVYAKGAEQSDDITMLGVRFLSKTGTL